MALFSQWSVVTTPGVSIAKPLLVVVKYGIAKLFTASNLRNAC